MLGSSSTNSVFTSDVPSAVVRLMRCTSPPLRRAALPVEREVANAHVALEVPQPGVDFFQTAGQAWLPGAGL